MDRVERGKRDGYESGRAGTVAAVLHPDEGDGAAQRSSQREPDRGAGGGVLRDVPVISKGAVWLLTVLAAFTVANLYYNQPLLPDIARTFGVSNGHAGIVAVLTQIGYAVGLI